MTRAVLFCLIVFSSARAQVVECPSSYPQEEVSLAAPYAHKGKGLVMEAKLSGAGVYTGAWNGREELVGDAVKVRGGHDTRYGFAPGDVRWLVCAYGQGGEIRWWEELDRRAGSCVLELRGRGPVTAKMTCNAVKPGR